MIFASTGNVFGGVNEKEKYKDLTEDDEPRLANIRCPTLVIGVTSDLLFPVWQQRELAELLEKGGAPTTYVELDAPFGHDTFLILRGPVGDPLKRHLEQEG